MRENNKKLAHFNQLLQIKMLKIKEYSEQHNKEELENLFNNI
jgi:hypothetical protein